MLNLEIEPIKMKEIKMLQLNKQTNSLQKILIFCITCIIFYNNQAFAIDEYIKRDVLIMFK